MLSIKPLTSAKANCRAYYERLIRYYTQGEALSLEWWGKGAERLDPSGQQPTVEVFRHLFLGRWPDGTPAVQKLDQHVPGDDLTFSLPKALSVLGALNKELMPLILEAHRKGVDAALKIIEEEVAQVRRGKGGRFRESAELIALRAVEWSNRNGEPQLHEHVVLFNLAFGKDGRLTARERARVYRGKMLAGAVYRAEVSAELEKAGLRLERDGSSFTLAGRDWLARKVKEVAGHFSTRRKEIVRALKERGLLGDARAAEAMALLTRGKKQKELPHAELVQRWKEEAKSLGLDPDSLIRLRGPVQKRDPEKELKEALQKGLARVTEQQSFFTEHQLLRYVAEESQARGLSACRIRTGVKEALCHSAEIVRLGRERGEVLYSTKEILATEEKVLDVTRKLAANQSHGAGRLLVEGVIVKHTVISAVKRALGMGGYQLSSEQKEAVRHLTQASGISVLSGIAGSGKTSTLRLAAEAWRKAGYSVYGASLSGKAARGLQDGAGIESRTIARMLKDLDRSWLSDALDIKHHAKQILRAAVGKKTYAKERFRLTKKSVLVIDEAAMADSVQLRRLMEHAERAGAKVALAGDPKQLQPIGRGGGFLAVAKEVGEARLTEITRQKEAWAREVVSNFAQGNAREALAALMERGLLSVAPHRNAAKDELIAAWKEKALRNLRDNLILCSTNQEARELNAKAQAERLKTTWGAFRHVKAGDETIYEGDRVLFTRNTYRFGGINNGDLGTVKHIDMMLKRVTVELDRGETVTVSLRQYQHMQLGFCVTSHKSQGMSLDKDAYVLAGGGMQDLHSSYVQASRARGNTRIFTDRLEAGEEFCDLARQMSRSREKVFAHEILERERARTRELERGL